MELVAPEATYPLRQRVLRPHQRVTEVRVPGEDGRDAAHIAAVDANGDVVGTAVLVREMCPLLPERNLAWRLRGMATDERLRGQGIGGRDLMDEIPWRARKAADGECCFGGNLDGSLTTCR